MRRPGIGKQPLSCRPLARAASAAVAVGLQTCLAMAVDPRVPPVDPFDVPAAQATAAGLYISAADALQMLSLERDVLLIDVRARAEAHRRGAVGARAEIVPFFVPTPGGGLVRNPHFVAGIRRAMAIRGLKPGATILLICDQAIQSAQAADDLALHAFPNVYTVIGGVTALRKAKAALPAAPSQH